MGAHKIWNVSVLVITVYHGLQCSTVEQQKNIFTPGHPSVFCFKNQRTRYFEDIAEEIDLG